jgi:hypothetical protein
MIFIYDAGTSEVDVMWREDGDRAWGDHNLISFCMDLVLPHLVVILHCIYVHSFIVYSTSHQGYSLPYATRVGGNGEFATAI